MMRSLALHSIPTLNMMMTRARKFGIGMAARCAWATAWTDHWVVIKLDDAALAVYLCFTLYAHFAASFVAVPEYEEED
jgi:hypothetical protein